MKLPNAVRLPIIALLGALPITFVGCGSTLKMGDTDSAKRAMELAIQCKTDDAIATSRIASQSGGLGGALGDMERLVILSEAGRTAQADAARATLLSGPGAVSAAELDKTTMQGVEQIRSDRAKRTGKRQC